MHSTQSSSPIEGGYCLLSQATLTNVLGALIDRAISYRAARVFFACCSMRSIREAAARCQIRKHQKIQFRFDEIRQRVGTQSEKLIRADLKQLERSGLLSFTQDAIEVVTVPINFTQSFDLGRSMRRLIPVPRRILEYLAQCPSPSVLRGIIVYVLRGLTLRQGIVYACGSVKSSWVAQIAHISLRAAKSVRAHLIEIGWLTKDTGSTQRKLNATGAFFRINTQWRRSSSTTKQPRAVDNSTTSDSQSAPLIAKLGSKSAPPIQDLKTSTNSKDQKSSKSLPGVYQQTQKISPPILHNIQANDLYHFHRLELLYWQAIAAKWLIHSEASTLNWICAAVRAREVVKRSGGNAVKVFVTIVRRKLWNTITGTQEDYARKSLVRFRETCPQLFRHRSESDRRISV
ncbi:hypothetical protein NIES2135_65080 (plasmid) [Leptolyngbya boryana NIES-2135]|jgi:hypothetical protein|uniref:Uncharacterized protein n=1 Tax=Leptolyngbya boryana NIES-2135 TaxID=1973484 RepID=A0A1Z4JS86_LEPBY|nr:MULTISPECIES: hypothetical protein [Leptolyngbya]BAY59631.1 hypothetical protein NIES2135_65080 [Leptolyngbya boryana NIES-2135]MBD2371186.1 hypothetical protein [Leptolyngbya sp. FACHB-161]MBD2377850.1 hypothetical protein [Leptolyngbya sp. FACHB-238]MBD2402288.1 hypothetical protein [Leptolyngbya sp. FACHB-239]MBD2409031.1 hypothetical protein [Leptolyngbya sp. FACHB-402]